MGVSRFIPLIALLSFLIGIVCTSNSMHAQGDPGYSIIDPVFLITQNDLFANTYFEEIELYQTEEDSADAFKQKKIYLIFRMGLGSSAHLGESSQIAIDLKPNCIPIAFSFVSESYRKTPLKKKYAKPYDTFYNAVNLFYMPYQSLKKRINYFLGGGFGRVTWEKYERTDDSDWRQNPFAIEKGLVSNIEMGLHIKLFWKVTFYAEGKYIYAKKEQDGVKVIDINSHAWMIGLSLNLGFFDDT